MMKMSSSIEIVKTRTRDMTNEQEISERYLFKSAGFSLLLGAKKEFQYDTIGSIILIEGSRYDQ